MGYKGFDYCEYPGDTFMSNWWQGTPFYHVGFYLAPAPEHSNTSFMSKKSYIENIGYGFLPIYVGRQDWSKYKTPTMQLTEANGRTDAQNAAKLARDAGFGQSTIIYLDVESGTGLSTEFKNYVYGFCKELYDNTTEFYPGIYCHKGAISELEQRLGIAYTSRTTFWAYYPCCNVAPGCYPLASIEPTDCGESDAKVWQYARSPLECGDTGTSCCDNKGYTDVGSDKDNRKCRLTYNGYTLDVDLNVATKVKPHIR